MKDNQRIALTKRLLKEGLLRLMKEKPLEKINVSELCKESGINRATFYRHYELPRDILDDMERELIGGLDIEAWQITCFQDVVHYFEKTLEYMYVHADMLRILLNNHSDEEFTNIINEICGRMFVLNARIHFVRELDMDSSRLLSAYSVGGIYFLLRQWLLGDIHKTPAEIVQLLLQILNIEENKNV